jgi:hypothetical protein
VRNLDDLISRVLTEYVTRGLPVKKLVIGTHGAEHVADNGKGYGVFFVGSEEITGYDDNDLKKIERLRMPAPVFTPDANVYIFSCKTGNDTGLLKKISRSLGWNQGSWVHRLRDFEEFRAVRNDQR